MGRPRHPKKEIEDAIEYAEGQGWNVEVRGRGHAWGQMRCPYNDDECRCGQFCRVGIWSTPRSPGNHAKDLKRVVDNCTAHKKELLKQQMEKMMEYEFTLKYQLAEKDNDLDELLERFGAEGCDDAVIGVGLVGRVGLKFTREAGTAKDALLSAMADVRRVIPTAKLIEAGPDFVGLTDVADLVKMSRQNLRKLMTTHASNFPLPVHEGSSAVWHLADLLNWLQAKGEYILPQGVVEVSNTTKRINVAKQAMQISAADQHEMAELVY